MRTSQLNLIYYGFSRQDQHAKIMTALWYVFAWTYSTHFFSFIWPWIKLGCHSSRILHIFGKLDYSGIALLTMGSFVPWVYYTFYCEELLGILYCFWSFCIFQFLHKIFELFSKHRLWTINIFVNLIIW